MASIKKVYGPYMIKNPNSSNYGRKQVVIYYEDGSRRTMLLSRHVMEEHLGRQLLPEETVDHIDRDKTNDVLENLRVVGKSLHISEDTRRVKRVEVACVWCGTMVLRDARQMEHRARQGKSGPFCGKSCVGEYGAEVQNGREPKKSAQPVGYIREYYQVDKE